MRTLHFETNCDILPPLLNGDLPDGVRVTFTPPVRHRSLEPQIAVNVDFNISVDLTRIAGMVFAAWFVKHVAHFRRRPQIRVDGKELPTIEADAVKMLSEAVGTSNEPPSGDARRSSAIPVTAPEYAHLLKHFNNGHPFIVRDDARPESSTPFRTREEATAYANNNSGRSYSGYSASGVEAPSLSLFELSLNGEGALEISDNLR